MITNFRFLLLKSGQFALAWRWSEEQSPENEIQQYRLYFRENLNDTPQILTTLPPSHEKSFALDPSYYGKYFSIDALLKNGNSVGFQDPITPVFVPKPDAFMTDTSLKLPSWFELLPIEQQMALLRHPGFSSWLVTTPLLDSDPRHLYQDNPNRTPEQILWRNDDYLLFHGDELARGPDEVFETGMTAASPISGKMNMKQPFEDGSLSSYAYFFHDTSGYATIDAQAGSRYVYISCAPGGVDVSGSFSQGHYEVAYITGVRRHYIVGCAILDENQMVTAFRFNPYAPVNPQKNEKGMVTIISSLSPNDAHSQQLKLTNIKTGKVFYFKQYINVMPIDRYKVELIDENSANFKIVDWYLNGSITKRITESIEIDLAQNIDGVVILDAVNEDIN